MDGNKMNFVTYMQSSNHFVIPLYQRHYDWRRENCKQLFEDLKKIVFNHRKSHFFGSIVSVRDPSAFNELLIIDGQQRLTTVSLLLLALRNLLKTGKLNSTDSNLADRIYYTCLFDQWGRPGDQLKLKPIKSDYAAYEKLFGDPDEHIQGSTITNNYQFFYDLIQKEQISADQLFDAVMRLEIINIWLTPPDDNPQLIFESLNSTGLALSEGDKIRNYILMGLPSKEQNEFFEKYWSRIESLTDGEVSLFVRDYLSIKQQVTPALNRIYFSFKEYAEENQLSNETLLQDLLAYAKLYRILLHEGTSSKVLNACIFRLNRLETSVTRPFLLEVLRLNTSGRLSMEDTVSIFLTTENYLFRRVICDLPTNALNKIFLTLHREIIRFDGTDEQYLAKFGYALLSKKEKARFPKDTEFIEKFTERSIYHMNSKNKIYIFERMENFDTLEDKDIYRHCDDDEYSIEHIMPQSLSPAWKDILGENYESIHATWLHRLANLTLVASSYNSKYSNASFNQKKTMPHGFLDSGLRMNQWIALKENWTLAELEERNEHLMNRALAIWAMPSSEYCPVQKQLDCISLDDDTDLSGRMIARFAYKNAEQPVTSWVDMFERILKILHAEDESVLSALAYNPNHPSELSPYVSNNPNALRNTLEIDRNIFVERNTSTSTKLMLLRRFFKLYRANPADLVFYLRDENEEEANLAGTRYALRKEYWTFALNYIKAAHGGNGSFSNVNPSKDNWISGFFGIGDFNVSCVANYNCARVDLYMGKPKAEENKRAFDFLLSHKESIEAVFGVSLTWHMRSKTAKVSYSLNTVSIENRSDWTQMAKFHAEWSRRFVDVFVPYLKQIF